MLSSRIYDYSDAYILASGTITINGAGPDDDAKRTKEKNKGVIFKNCKSFIERTSEISNTQIDYTNNRGVEMLKYNLIEHSDNYSKTSRNLLQCYRDELALPDAGSIKSLPDSKD